MPEIKAIVVSKKWYMSKTLYLNAISIIIMCLQTATGTHLIPLEIQGTIIAILNIIVRTITNSNLVI